MPQDGDKALFLLLNKTMAQKWISANQFNIVACHQNGTKTFSYKLRIRPPKNLLFFEWSPCLTNDGMHPLSCSSTVCAPAVSTCTWRTQATWTWKCPRPLRRSTRPLGISASCVCCRASRSGWRHRNSSNSRPVCRRDSAWSTQRHSCPFDRKTGEELMGEKTFGFCETFGWLQAWRWLKMAQLCRCVLLEICWNQNESKILS